MDYNIDEFRGSDVHGGDDVDQSMIHNTSHVHNESSSSVSDGSITPVNIRQLINADMKETNQFEIDYKTKKKRIEQVTLVAQIVKFTNEPERRKLNLFIDDGTGKISVILYAIDTEKKFAMNEGIDNGLFLRIFGILNVDPRTGTRYIVGTNLSLLTDINELTTHMLDVIVASLHCQYGSLIGKNVPKVIQKPLEVSIHELIERRPGIAFHDVVTELNSDFNATVNAFQTLFDGGYLGYVPNSTEQYVVANKLPPTFY